MSMKWSLPRELGAAHHTPEARTAGEARGWRQSSGPPLGAHPFSHLDHHYRVRAGDGGPSLNLVHFLFNTTPRPRRLPSSSEERLKAPLLNQAGSRVAGSHTQRFSECGSLLSHSRDFAAFALPRPTIPGFDRRRPMFTQRQRLPC
jgi:hypothetical protein